MGLPLPRAPPQHLPSQAKWSLLPARGLQALESRPGHPTSSSHLKSSNRLRRPPGAANNLDLSSDTPIQSSVQLKISCVCHTCASVQITLAGVRHNFQFCPSRPGCIRQLPGLQLTQLSQKGGTRHNLRHYTIAQTRRSSVCFKTLELMMCLNLSCRSAQWQALTRAGQMELAKHSGSLFALFWSGQ